MLPGFGFDKLPLPGIPPPYAVPPPYVEAGRLAAGACACAVVDRVAFRLPAPAPDGRLLMSPPPLPLRCTVATRAAAAAVENALVPRCMWNYTIAPGGATAAGHWLVVTSLRTFRRPAQAARSRQVAQQRAVSRRGIRRVHWMLAVMPIHTTLTFRTSAGTVNGWRRSDPLPLLRLWSCHLAGHRCRPRHRYYRPLLTGGRFAVAHPLRSLRVAYRDARPRWCRAE